MRRIETLLCVVLLLTATGVPTASAVPQVSSVAVVPPPTAQVTTKALKCAAGGPCKVGDRGPGGGIVFYVHPRGGTFSCGPTLAESCRYLEVAPRNHPTDAAWCSDSTTLLGATATAIGTGLANTTTAEGACTAGAIQVAAAYSNRGKTDWYLPSKDELNELCKYAHRMRTGNTAVRCNGKQPLRPGFAFDFYWSSSEHVETGAWGQGFADGTQGSYDKRAPDWVRPVRAF